MAETLQMGTMFPPELLADLYNKVKGKSSIAALHAADPVPFTGNEIMTFSMDDEIALVGESEEKTAGSTTIEPVSVIPVKVEYGSRVSDEFMKASEEEALQILEAWNTGFAAKVARGLDIIAMHKMNPRTAQESDLIKSSFKDVKNIQEYNAGEYADDNLQEAIELIGDYDCNGIAFSKKFAGALGRLKASGIRLYPNFAFGSTVTDFEGVPASVNSTVDFDNETQCIVGDFVDACRWGISAEIPLEVIPYGDPDNTDRDLKGHNEVYLRAETWIGFAILDTAAFAKITGEVSNLNNGNVTTASATTTMSAKKSSK